MKCCFNALGLRSSLSPHVSHNFNCGSESRGMLPEVYFYGLGQIKSVMQNDLMLNIKL